MSAQEEARFAKIDEAIQRLAGVAADVSKMLAVHEQKINYQEKTIDNLLTSFEKRRAEIDNRFKEMHDDLRAELHTSRENSKNQHNEQNVKIEAIQKYIWMAMGVVSVVSWVVPIVINKFFH